jgi:predicted dehydrogenase
LCTAIGEKGSLRWNGLTGEILFFEKGSNRWITIFSGENEIDNSYYAEWVHFIACTIKEETPLVTGEDGFQVLKIIDLARKSFVENHK